MNAQTSLFADLEPAEDEPLAGFLFTCRAGHTRRVNVASVAAVLTARCHCGRVATGKRIIGTRTGHRCDARCMFATGPDCQCSCGGANHGIGFGHGH